ncbi:hypothetical protein EMCG_05871 [[Emmonsia] crescens]|uniref:Uncharacterized protein n=1 Tax=[Emmonsia] crescens TaxID=73230 RepID=A0A0G2J7I0_9EURO|nr:hypothetical protein EMCG_05871 [Emmonsia crescens UAMH 3008]
MTSERNLRPRTTPRVTTPGTVTENASLERTEAVSSALPATSADAHHRNRPSPTQELEDKIQAETHALKEKIKILKEKQDLINLQKQHATLTTHDASTDNRNTRDTNSILTTSTMSTNRPLLGLIPLWQDELKDPGMTGRST